MLKVLFFLTSGVGLACGIATHAWVSKVAMTKVDGELAVLLNKYRDYVYNGSYFPDSGFSDWTCNASYGETAHWPQFQNIYVDFIKETCRQTNGKISLEGDCGALIAFFMGAVSHGLTDQWHDAHFLTKMVELGYFANEEDAQTVTDRGLDATAINNPVFGIMDDVPEPDAKPRLDHITTIMNRALQDLNRPLTDLETIRCATELMSLARMLEPFWAYYSEPKYLLEVPRWAFDNRLSAAGGIYDNASYVASNWKEFWSQITEGPAGVYRPKKIYSSGGWPRVHIWWEDVRPTRTKTRTTGF